MSRSLKKGPFVQPRLLERIHAMNEAGEKKVIKTWSRARPSSRRWSVTRSACTTVGSTFRCTSPSRWSATSSASSRRRVRSAVTRPRTRRARGRAHGSQSSCTLRAGEPAQGPTGGRPHSRQVHRRRSRDPEVLAARRGGDRREGAQQRRGQRGAQRCTSKSDDLLVGTTFVDEGPTLKRIQPRAMGRAFRINKRTSHITVVVKQREGA